MHLKIIEPRVSIWICACKEDISYVYTLYNIHILWMPIYYIYLNQPY